MLWDVLTPDEKNRVLLKWLVQVSRADEHLAKNEFAYLVHVCHQLSLDTELIREYAREQDKHKEALPESEEERMHILYHLLFVMKADGVIQPEEEKILFEMAFRLGFSEAMTKDFIDVIRSAPLDKIPSGALLNVIRKYNN